jgi:hypothetical protein
MFTELLACAQLINLLLLPTFLVLRAVCAFLQDLCDRAVAALRPQPPSPRLPPLHYPPPPLAYPLQPTPFSHQAFSRSISTQTPNPSTKELWHQYQKALR